MTHHPAADQPNPAYAWADSEISAIKSFVDGGGGLLLMSNHFNYAEYDAVLADAFSITLQNVFISNPQGYMVMRPTKAGQCRPARVSPRSSRTARDRSSSSETPELWATSAGRRFPRAARCSPPNNLMFVMNCIRILGGQPQAPALGACFGGGA